MPPSIADLEAMVAAGASAQQLLVLIRPMLQAMQRKREYNRLRNRKVRKLYNVAQQPNKPRKQQRNSSCTTSDNPNGFPHPSLTLPSTDVANATSVSVRDRPRKRSLPKIPFPDPWPWPIALDDSNEFERFKAHALANDRRQVRWDQAWRLWQTSPFRKSNAGQSNGNGRIETFGERCKRLHTAIVEREQELGLGVQGTPPDVGGIRGRS
jgi:hypothetical protein